MITIHSLSSQAPDKRRLMWYSQAAALFSQGFAPGEEQG